jgi:hypothetical protein
MKKIIIVIGILFSNYTVFSQSGNFVSGGTCTVPVGWTSCTSSCWFSDCCIVWNPNVSEGGCGCWFGVALCRTALIGQNLQISNTSSSDAKVKFSFERFVELINFLNTKGIETNSISNSVTTFQRNYTSFTGKVDVETSDYINFQNSYIAFINTLSIEQKNLITSFISEKENAAKPQ